MQTLGYAARACHGPNNLAYLDHSLNTSEKSFITWVPRLILSGKDNCLPLRDGKALTRPSSGLTCKYSNRLEVLVRYKPSSLFGIFVVANKKLECFSLTFFFGGG